MEQAERPVPRASRPQAAVQPKVALQEAARRELPRKLEAEPELQVSPLVAPLRVAEAQLAQADAPVVQRLPLSSA